MTAVDRAVPDTALSRAWRLHGIALAFLILLILIEFRHDVAAAVQVWWIYETYSHCFLIIPISLWLVWEKRHRLALMQPAVELRALWVMPVLLLVWGIGELATINEVRQFAIVGLMELVIVAMLGTKVFRVVWFPALYLVFLVPTGQYLIGPLQRFATIFVDLSLNAIGLAHHTEGTVIELTTGNFEIAEACAGLRFLVATVALGTLFAYLMFRKWYKAALFLAACIVVPLIGNGLRVVGIILLAHYTNNQYGVGVDHIVYGWGFNVAILFVLFLLGSLFRDPMETSAPVPSENATADRREKVVAVLAGAALLISAGPALAWWNENRIVTPNVSSLTSPFAPAGWHVGEMDGVWHPNYPASDAAISQSLRPEQLTQERPVDVYVAYYAQSRAGHVLTAHVNYLWNPEVWTPVSSARFVARLNGRDIEMQEWIVRSAGERRMIWASYWIGGEFAAGPLQVRFLQARASLLGRDGEALVALSSVVDGTDVEARHRLSNALGALKDLPARLDATLRAGQHSQLSN